MDVWAPDAVGLRPGVLFIHGGGWSAGRRSQFSSHARRLAQEGYVAASADYRLSGVAPWPAALEDCQCAMRWLRVHAAELGLDPARVGAFGSSAGGHLAACLGVRDERQDGVSSRAQCVVDVHGIHDFPSLHFKVILECAATFLGGDLRARPEAWADASPIRFVDASTAPMLLIHAPDDPTVPFDQSEALAAALIKAGRPCEFIRTPGSGHGFIYNLEGEWSQKVWPLAGKWLAAWLEK